MMGVTHLDPMRLSEASVTAWAQDRSCCSEPLLTVIPFASRITKQPQKTTFYSALHYHEAYITGRLTPIAVVEALLPLIRRDIKGAHSISFLSTKVDIVRKAAEASTARYKAGKPLSPLDGVPMAVKDEQDLTGYPKSLGSRLDFTNKDDVTSHCVQLWLDAGAICVGKTTMHELGSHRSIHLVRNSRCTDSHL